MPIDRFRSAALSLSLARSVGSTLGNQGFLRHGKFTTSRGSRLRESTEREKKGNIYTTRKRGEPERAYKTPFCMCCAQQPKIHAFIIVDRSLLSYSSAFNFVEISCDSSREREKKRTQEDAQRRGMRSKREKKTVLLRCATAAPVLRSRRRRLAHFARYPKATITISAVRCAHRHDTLARPPICFDVCRRRTQNSTTTAPSGPTYFPAGQVLGQPRKIIILSRRLFDLFDSPSERVLQIERFAKIARFKKPFQEATVNGCAIKTTKPDLPSRGCLLLLSVSAGRTAYDNGRV